MKWFWKGKEKKPDNFEELFQVIRELCQVGREYSETVNKMIGK